MILPELQSIKQLPGVTRSRRALRVLVAFSRLLPTFAPNLKPADSLTDTFSGQTCHHPHFPRTLINDGIMDTLMFQRDEATRDRVRQALEFLDPRTASACPSFHLFVYANLLPPQMTNMREATDPTSS
jgi:hypothetical protein